MDSSHQKQYVLRPNLQFQNLQFVDYPNLLERRLKSQQRHRLHPTRSIIGLISYNLDSTNCPSSPKKILVIRYDSLEITLRLVEYNTLIFGYFA